MEEAVIRHNLAENLTRYRKDAGMTQLELSEKINYSDKSVSKWERGEGLPDVTVLVQLSELFGITVNDLLSSPESQPKVKPLKKHRFMVTMMAIGIVWLVAAVVFYGLKLGLPSRPRTWLPFVCAIPVTGIVATVFTTKWWPWYTRLLSVSMIIWGIALTAHISALAVENMGLIYVIAGVLEFLFVIWYGMRNVKH